MLKQIWYAYKDHFICNIFKHFFPALIILVPFVYYDHLKKH
jgi:hypothetical protein